MYTFMDWYKTPWEKIDTDFLMEETKASALNMLDGLVWLCEACVCV